MSEKCHQQQNMPEQAVDFERLSLMGLSWFMHRE
jgi:hypothetical protein